MVLPREILLVSLCYSLYKVPPAAKAGALSDDDVRLSLSPEARATAGHRCRRYFIPVTNFTVREIYASGVGLLVAPANEPYLF